MDERLERKMYIPPMYRDKGEAFVTVNKPRSIGQTNTDIPEGMELVDMGKPQTLLQASLKLKAEINKAINPIFTPVVEWVSKQLNRLSRKSYSDKDMYKAYAAGMSRGYIECNTNSMRSTKITYIDWIEQYNNK